MIMSQIHQAIQDDDILYVVYRPMRRRCRSDIDFDMYRLPVANATATPTIFRPNSVGIGTDVAGYGDTECYTSR